MESSRALPSCASSPAKCTQANKREERLSFEALQDARSHMSDRLSLMAVRRCISCEVPHYPLSHSNHVQVWDVHGSGKCMRTYLGHTAGVRQANFNHDGTKFVTVSYDKQMHWWDTETRQARARRLLRF